MTTTIANEIPFVPESTTDPAAGLNLSIKVIDALLQIVVVARQNDPPVSPVEGERYLVGDTATGAWAGEEDKLAQYLDAGWNFYGTARYVVNLDDGLLWVRNGSGWTDIETLLMTTPSMFSVPVYANNAAAVSGGLAVGDVYRTGGDPDNLCIVH